jgi:hypothetical protein
VNKLLGLDRVFPIENSCVVVTLKAVAVDVVYSAYTAHFGDFIITCVVRVRSLLHQRLAKAVENQACLRERTTSSTSMKIFLHGPVS